MQYAAVITQKGVSLNSVSTIVDGTLHRLCDFTISQKTIYNRWKHIAGLKYQEIVAPDSLIVYLFRRVFGCIYDLIFS